LRGTSGPLTAPCAAIKLALKNADQTQINQSHKFAITDEARKIWREGRGEKICLFSDQSGVICHEQLAAALGLSAFIAMPNLRELAEQLSETSNKTDGDTHV
jgi:hypothetical protein